MNGIDLHALLVGVWGWARERLLNQDAAVQGLVIALALLVGWAVGRAVLRPVRRRWADSFDSRHFLHRLARTGIYLIPAACVAVALGLVELALARADHPAALAHTAFSLSLAWIAAHLGTSLLQRDPISGGAPSGWPSGWPPRWRSRGSWARPRRSWTAWPSPWATPHISLLAVIKAAILLTVLWAWACISRSTWSASSSPFRT